MRGDHEFVFDTDELLLLLRVLRVGRGQANLDDRDRRKLQEIIELFEFAAA